jgi:hypothetical protein
LYPVGRKAGNDPNVPAAVPGWQKSRRFEHAGCCILSAENPARLRYPVGRKAGDQNIPAAVSCWLKSRQSEHTGCCCILLAEKPAI